MIKKKTTLQDLNGISIFHEILEKGKESSTQNF